VPKVTRRIYDEDDEGRRFLLHRPGDFVSDAEAERIETLVEAPPDKPCWMRLLERRDEQPAPPPPKRLSRMNVAELRAVCEAEGLDASSANLRGEYVAIIEAGRAAAGANKSER
jgi:hypothetical protein